MSERICSKCGAVLEEYEKFCTHCGQKYEEKKAKVCENCGNPLEDTDKFCTRCGCRVERAETQTAENVPEVESVSAAENTTLADAAAPAGNENIAEGEARTGTESAPAAASTQNTSTESGAQDSIYATDSIQTAPGGEASASGAAPDQPQPEENVKQKFSEKIKNLTQGSWKEKLHTGNKKTVIIVAAVAAVLVVGGVANAARISNFAHKTFSSPEKYYQYVEKQTAKDIASAAAAQYEGNLTMLSFPLGIGRLLLEDGSMEGELAIWLEEEGMDMLSMAGMAGVDLSWIEGGTISGKIAMDGNVLQAGGGVAVNKKQVVSASAVVDCDGESVYAQIPELTSIHLGADMDTLGMDIDADMIESLDLARQVLKELPDDKQVEKLVNKYLMIALGNVDDVSKKNKVLKAGSIKQKCTELEVTFDGDTLMNIMEEVLEEAKNDKELEKLIVSIADATGEVDGEEAYEAFLEGIEYAQDDIEDSYFGDEEIVMNVYVDGKGIIRGREIMSPYGESVKFAMPRKGSKFAFELSAWDETNKLGALEGEGKYSGSKLNGEFEIKAMGASIVECNVKDLDTEQLKKGFVNGSFSMQPSSSVRQMIEAAGVPVMGNIVPKLGLDMDLSSDGNQVAAKATLIYDEDALANIVCELKADENAKIALPKEKDVIFVEDAADVEDYLDEVDWEKVLTTLDDIGVPSQYTEMLENYLDMLEGFGLEQWN